MLSALVHLPWSSGSRIHPRWDFIYRYLSQNYSRSMSLALPSRSSSHSQHFPVVQDVRPDIRRDPHVFEDQLDDYTIVNRERVPLPPSTLLSSYNLVPNQSLPKPLVRTLASALSLPTANNPESMGICFVGERRRFSDFVSQYIPSEPGPILHVVTGKEVGRHQGVWEFTIGQGAKLPGLGEKLFVARKEREGSKVWVAPAYVPLFSLQALLTICCASFDRDHLSLYASSLTTSNFTWIWPSPPAALQDPSSPMKALVKIRHKSPCIPAFVSL